MTGIVIAFVVGIAAGAVGTIIAAKKGWIDLSKVPSP